MSKWFTNPVTRPHENPVPGDDRLVTYPLGAGASFTNIEDQYNTYKAFEQVPDESVDTDRISYTTDEPYNSYHPTRYFYTEGASKQGVTATGTTLVSTRAVTLGPEGETVSQGATFYRAKLSVSLKTNANSNYPMSTVQYHSARQYVYGDPIYSTAYSIDSTGTGEASSYLTLDTRANTLSDYPTTYGSAWESESTATDLLSETFASEVSYLKEFPTVATRNAVFDKYLTVCSTDSEASGAYSSTYTVLGDVTTYMTTDYTYYYVYLYYYYFFSYTTTDVFVSLVGTSTNSSYWTIPYDRTYQTTSTVKSALSYTVLGKPTNFSVASSSVVQDADGQAVPYSIAVTNNNKFVERSPYGGMSLWTVRGGSPAAGHQGFTVGKFSNVYNKDPIVSGQSFVDTQGFLRDDVIFDSFWRTTTNQLYDTDGNPKIAVTITGRDLRQEGGEGGGGGGGGGGYEVVGGHTETGFVDKLTQTVELYTLKGSSKQYSLNTDNYSWESYSVGAAEPFTDSVVDVYQAGFEVVYDHPYTSFKNITVTREFPARTTYTVQGLGAEVQTKQTIVGFITKEVDDRDSVYTTIHRTSDRYKGSPSNWSGDIALSSGAENTEFGKSYFGYSNYAGNWGETRKSNAGYKIGNALGNFREYYVTKRVMPKGILGFGGLAASDVLTDQDVYLTMKTMSEGSVWDESQHLAMETSDGVIGQDVAENGVRLFATNCETFGDRVQTTKWFPTNTDAISSPGSDTVTCIAATNSSTTSTESFRLGDDGEPITYTTTSRTDLYVTYSVYMDQSLDGSEKYYTTGTISGIGVPYQLDGVVGYGTAMEQGLQGLFPDDKKTVQIGAGYYTILTYKGGVSTFSTQPIVLSAVSSAGGSTGFLSGASTFESAYNTVEFANDEYAVIYAMPMYWRSVQEPLGAFEFQFLGRNAFDDSHMRWLDCFVCPLGGDVWVGMRGFTYDV